MQTTRKVVEEDGWINARTFHDGGWIVASDIFLTSEIVDRKVAVYHHDRLVIELLLRNDGQFSFSARRHPRAGEHNSEYVTYWGDKQSIPGAVMQEAFLRLYEWNGE